MIAKNRKGRKEGATGAMNFICRCDPGAFFAPIAVKRRINCKYPGVGSESAKDLK